MSNREEISNAINRAMRSVDMNRNPAVASWWSDVGAVNKDLFVWALTDALCGEEIKWGFSGELTSEGKLQRI